MYFNEKDIAYLRIKELYNSVDYFVINEATKTHQGQNKELSFWKDERLQEFKDKIIYSPIELDGRYDHILPKYFPDGIIGAKEHEQRIRLYEQLEKLNLEDEDVIMISDCDEIPNRNIFEDIKNKLKKNLAIALNQMFFVHYINVYTNKNVTGTVCIKYKKLKEINNQTNNMAFQIARRDKDFIPRLENGGWHYSYMGGAKSVSQKVVSTYDGNLNSQWKTEEASKQLIENTIKTKNSPFSQMPLEILDLNIRDRFIEFLTAKDGQWIKNQGFYQFFPNIVGNNPRNYKHMIYE